MKKILKDKKLYIYLGVVIMFFGLFYKLDFATDTFSVIENSGKSILINFLQAGRYITGLAFCVYKFLRIPLKVTYAASFTLAIISTTLSIYVISKVIGKFIKNDIVTSLVAISTIINPFLIEEFMYIEKGIMLSAILFTCIAIMFFEKYLENKQKRNLFLSFIFMILSIVSYQGVIGIFIPIAAIFIIKQSKNIKDFIVNTILSLLLYGIPAIINLLSIKLLFSSSRVKGAVIISESISKIIAGSKQMLNTYGIIPKKLFIILLLVLFVATIVIILINKKNKKTKLLEILGLLYVIGMTYGIAIAPQLVQKTSSIWFVARSTYPFAAIIGIIALYNIVIVNNEKAIKYFINGFLLVFLIIELFSFYKVEVDHYILNYKDEERAIKINEEIVKYEKENNVKIENIAFYRDANLKYTYNNLFVAGDINISAFGTDWSDLNSINYYNNTQYKKIEKDNTIEQEFSKYDWAELDSKQFIFIDNTLHLCVY